MKRHSICCAALLVFALSVAFPATLKGKVVSEAGEPIAGATVWVYFADGHSLEVVSTTVTADDGSFVVEDPGRDTLDGTKQQRYTVYLHKPDLSVECAEIRDTAKLHEITLAQPAPISGRILGEGGLPLEGATIELQTASFGEWGSPERRHLSLTSPVREACQVHTDANGAFELRALPAGWEATLELSAGGYGRLQIGREADLGALQLEPAGRLRGRLVLDPKPDDFAPCTVSVSTELRDRHLHASATATAGEDGAFEFPELAPGRYSLSLHEQPSSTLHFLGMADIEVKPREEAVVEVVGEDAFPVRGRVLAADTGDPIEGAVVGLYRYAANREYSSAGRTGPDGRFELPCVAGEVSVSVTADGYSRSGVHERLPTVTVTPEGATVPDVRLERSRTLVVEVVDEAGDPVEGASVFAGSDPWMPDVTDEKGRSEATDLPPGPTEFWACKDDLALEQPRTVQVGEEEGPIRLVLRAGVLCTVTASIVDQDGNPVTDASIKAEAHAENRINYIECDPPDEQGRFRKTGLRPDRAYRLDVSAPNCDLVQTDEWAATHGAEHDFGVIRLRRQTGVVAGTVVDEAGEPMAGVNVFNSGDAPKRLTAITDKEGHFRLEGLDSGRAAVFVESGAHQFTGVLAEVGRENVKIALQSERPATIGPPPPPREPLVPEDEAKQMATALLVEALQQSKGSKSQRRRELLELFARIDVDAALQAAAEGGDDPAAVCLSAGRARLEEDFAEAFALILQHPSPDAQVSTLYEAAHTYQSGNPELAGQCIEQGLALIATMRNQALGTALKARLAALLFPLDEVRAVEALAEVQTQADSLAPTGFQAYARGVVAEAICERDLEGALALVEPIEDADERSRHLANIARRVAKTDPERALETIGHLGTDWYRERALAMAVPFFPQDQFQRAVELARGISDLARRARALARLASVAPEEQRPGLLEGALQALLVAAEQSDFTSGREAEAAAGVACVARRLGYSEYETLVWRAASIRVRGAGLYVDKSLNVQTDFDLATGRGSIVVNISHVRLRDAKRALTVMRAPLASHFCTARNIALLEPGQRLGNHIVPDGMVGFATVCSVTINGILHSQGIPVHSVFGGLLAVESYEPTRFIDLVQYGATSLDPLEIFIKGGATSVSQAVSRGVGIVGAGFREFPAVARDHVVSVVDKAARWGLHGVLAIGGPSQPLTEVQVGLGRCGMIVCAGLNAIAAVEEARIPTVSHAMETIVGYDQLTHIDEVRLP